MASIDSYIHRKMVILHQGRPIRQAAHAMREQDVGCVLVSDAKGELAGIVTDRDLACAMATLPDGLNVALSEVMTPQPVTVEVGASIEEAVRAMEEAGVRRIPIVERTPGGAWKGIGIVTLDDLIASKSIGYDHLARVVRSQIRRRSQKRRSEDAESPAENRSEARREQTVNHFYRVVSGRAGVPLELAADVSRLMLGALVRRLHYTGASKFVAQLPSALQQELLDLPAGPDRKITVASMRAELVGRLGFSEEHAARIESGFFVALGELVGRDEIENLVAQVPLEFRGLLRGGAAAA